MSSKSVRFAVVGLGHFAQTAILPAFANAKKRALLAALVTGDDEKAAELGKQYGVPTYKYEQYEELLGSGEIDAVYIALPNSMHREYTERAAEFGMHVLCEKPLAYTVEDAEAMVVACENAKVRLMTAYRLHFEEGNLDAIETIHSGRIGEPRLFTSTNTMQVAADNIRIDGSLGGGPLEDIGVYCINAARYLFRSEPEEVVAVAVNGDDRRFVEVPEAVSAVLRFPGERLATFLCGFGAAKASEYRVLATEGMLTMDPAYTWQDDIHQTIEVDGKSKSKRFKHRDQIAAEILYFAECIQTDQEPEPSGLEGLIDVRIIEALRTSYTEHSIVRMTPVAKPDRPDASQSIRRPASRQPNLVNAAPPSEE